MDPWEKAMLMGSSSTGHPPYFWKKQCISEHAVSSEQQASAGGSRAFPPPQPPQSSHRSNRREGMVVYFVTECLAQITHPAPLTLSRVLSSWMMPQDTIIGAELALETFKVGLGQSVYPWWALRSSSVKLAKIVLWKVRITHNMNTQCGVWHKINGSSCYYKYPFDVFCILLFPLVPQFISFTYKQNCGIGKEIKPPTMLGVLEELWVKPVISKIFMVLPVALPTQPWEQLQFSPLWPSSATLGTIY